MVYRNGRDECWHCGSTTHDTSECKHREPPVTPECWTTQELTETELNGICTWLMAWQRACVSGDSLAQDFIEEGELLPSQQLDPNFKTAMNHLQSLIRHIRATKR